MGNSCSSRSARRRKSREQDANPALLMIREAQRKYFNSHIESDLDDSEEDLEIDNEDSIDIYGSEDSLDNIDSVSVDSHLESRRSSKTAQQMNSDIRSVLNSSLPPSEEGRSSSASPPQTKSSGAVAPSSQILNEGAIKDQSGRDSGNGSVVQIVVATEATVTAAEPTGTTQSITDAIETTKDSSTAENSLTEDHASHSVHAYLKRRFSLRKDDSTEDKAKKDRNGSAKPTVRRRNKKRKYITLSRRGNFFSIFNQEDKKARSVDPSKYEYPFENLVFEGGGNKGLAYCGAVRVSLQ
ncbi:hypothetical protein PoB_004792900 [Plakobranchus ocellatus]|uniref:Uncharacterized protein n=1 Tax=Plakobranchus ocellatus TaxID=259542 RepID=A0AAV4BMS8_9GAST|nr:hypothetical protein PoB_004792900 [Plakobranchus ocellatus]